jgi:hypothetical protein
MTGGGSEPTTAGCGLCRPGQRGQSLWKQALRRVGRRGGRPYEGPQQRDTVGRATVPAKIESISGCGSKETIPPCRGLKLYWLATIGLH